MNFKRALWYSAFLHIILLIILMVGLPNPFNQTIPDEQLFNIEFEAVGEQRSAPEIQPQAIAKPEPKPEPKLEPKPEPKPEPQPEPEPVKAEEKSDTQPTSEIVEETPDIKDTPEPETETAPKDVPAEPIVPDAIEPSDLSPTPKVDEFKPRPVRRPKSIKALVNLEEKKEKSKKSQKSDFEKILEDAAFEDIIESANDAIPAHQISDKITANEMDLLRNHLKKCWIMPHGARNAADLNVDIKLNVAPDGTVLSAIIVDTARMNQDPFYRSAAESARRAVLHPECNPLPLPSGKYDQWKDMTLRFNPQKMLG